MATNVPNITIGTGAVGPAGMYLDSSTSWITAAPSYQHSFTTYANTAPHYSNDIVIRRDGKPEVKVAETLEMLLDRLCIIQPAIELIEKYPALREAYENYKMIEAMVKNGTDENE